MRVVRQAGRLHKDTAGAIMADAINRLPEHGGRLVKASYVPHIGKIVKWTEDSDRELILLQNRVEYEQNRVRKYVRSPRSDLIGGYPMRIPEHDWHCIRKKHPEADYSSPFEVRNKFLKKLYLTHPEYRTG